MAAKNFNDTAEPKLGQTLLTDLRRGDFKRTLRRDYIELKEFYLDNERKARLKGMGRIKRGFWMSWWLLKSLFFKLTPVRRILKAALLMVKLQAPLRALAADFTSLAELGAKLNMILRRDGLPNSFASLVYFELQSGSGTVRLLNAGHMPPLILKDGTIQETAHGGVAIGVMPEANFAEQQIEFQRGDTLLVYSDGLTEAANEAGEFFGEQRLSARLRSFTGLSAQQIGERLVATVDQFAGEARAHDDLSVIVLKRVGQN